MPEPSHIMRTYVEFLSFLTQLRRLKTSVTPDVIGEKYGLTEIGEQTEFTHENGFGESLKEKCEKCLPPVESNSSGKEAGVSIDVDISLEREEPPAPLTPIIIIANRNPVEVIDSRNEVTTKPAVKKKNPFLRENMDFSSIRTTRDCEDYRRSQRQNSTRFIILLVIASVVYVVACFGFMIHRRLQWSGDDMRSANVTRINSSLHILETNNTDMFYMINETVTSSSLL